MKVSTYEAYEKAAIEVLKKKKRPIMANEIHREIVGDYKVNRIRPSPNKLAYRLNNNPNVRVVKRKKGALYELL